MKVRESILPPGWYPDDPGEISRFLTNCTGENNVPRRPSAVAAVSPHAGWYYSGKTAAKAVASLNPAAETVVVIGGHLSSAMAPLFAMEDAVRTPFGPVHIDTQLRELLIHELDSYEDRYQDNTVEVLLPIVRFYLPNAGIVWMRLPARADSFATGKIIHQCAEKLGRNTVVLASADLTHYGNNYGFSPKGRGPAALKWVMEVNDAAFIQSVQAGDPDALVLCAEQDRSCCSAGSVAAAMGFARAEGAAHFSLLEYTTSAAQSDESPDSFVGYAAMCFENI